MRWQDHKPVAVTGQDDNSGNNGDYDYTTGNSTPLKLLIRRMPGTDIWHNIALACTRNFARDFKNR